MTILGIGAQVRLFTRPGVWCIQAVSHGVCDDFTATRVDVDDDGTLARFNWHGVAQVIAAGDTQVSTGCL